MFWLKFWRFSTTRKKFGARCTIDPVRLAFFPQFSRDLWLAPQLLGALLKLKLKTLNKTEQYRTGAQSNSFCEHDI